MKNSLLRGLCGCLLLLGCRQDPPAATTTPPNDALTDSIEALLPLTAPPAAAYPGPDPFVGSYRNDPGLEGFERRLVIDSTAGAGYRVLLTAEEVSGERLCRHAATFERVDTMLLRGSIEGYELLLYSAEAALEVRPVDATLRATPGLLCPGASIFGWVLPQWIATEGFADTLRLPERDEWLAGDYLSNYNRTRVDSGQPETSIRYETEILTRGDYDGDGAWDYAALLRDTSGRRGLYVRRGVAPPRRWERIADLTQRSGDSPTSYPAAGLTTPRGGMLPVTARAAGKGPYPSGILLQYYDSTAVFFHLEQNRWRRVALPGRSEIR